MMTPSIHEVDREKLTDGEYMELTPGDHAIYVTVTNDTAVYVVSNGAGEQASIIIDE